MYRYITYPVSAVSRSKKVAVNRDTAVVTWFLQLAGPDQPIPWVDIPNIQMKRVVLSGSNNRLIKLGILVPEFDVESGQLLTVTVNSAKIKSTGWEIRVIGDLAAD
jgi:hypothetical protein